MYNTDTNLVDTNLVTENSWNRGAWMLSSPRIHSEEPNLERGCASKLFVHFWSLGFRKSVCKET